MAEASNRSRVGVVVGSGTGIGAALRGALVERGHDVRGVSAADVDLTDPVAVHAALSAATGGEPPALVVLAHLEAASFRAAPLVGLDDDAWEAAAERSLRAAVVVLQQAHAAVPDGARVVIVLPTAAATGVPGLVPLCSAVEGIRVMAKAVARRWGARGVTVNTIEVDLAAFVGDAAPDGAEVPAVVQLGTSALGPGSAVDDVAGLVEVLASDAGAAVTGALLVADRGTVMVP
jgi:NAD(P)-dependent dehydrogenase (short-subunit alcohol dehydrogenase family)